MSSLLIQPQIPFWNFPDDDQAGVVHQQLRQTLETIFADLQQKELLPSAFEEFTREFHKAMTLHGWALLRFFLTGRWENPDVTASSLHVALVAWLVATSRAWTERKRELFVRAALLHDVGMLFVPPGLLHKEGKLSVQERSLIAAHPGVSFNLVKKWGESYESTQVAWQHHEEWSGGGYPQNLKEEAIHPWAALTAVLDNFVARSTQRSYRSSLVGYSAMKQLIAEQQKRFNPVWVKELVAVLGMYPPGSIVLLSDGSIARVTESQTGKPLRPRVRIMIDQFGTEFRQDRGGLVDLTASGNFIARPVDFRDVNEA